MHKDEQVIQARSIIRFGVDQGKYRALGFDAAGQLVTHKAAGRVLEK
jgi:hypothetical protein